MVQEECESTLERASAATGAEKEHKLVSLQRLDLCNKELFLIRELFV
jgi:hypothetical protein